MKAVIMAGGKGSRLMPLTKDIPKPMVKIIDKPVLEHTLLLLKMHGIREVAMTLGYKPQLIIDYFGAGDKWDMDITYFVEEEPLGTAGGVKRTHNFVGEDFLVMSGDAYTEIDLSKAISFHRAKESTFTLIAQPHQHPVGLGILEIDLDSRISAFIEKPEKVYPSLINTGIYVINKEVLSLIPHGFYDFGRQLIPQLLGKVYAYVDYAYWSDIGTLSSYYRTNEKVANDLEREIAIAARA